MQILIEYGIIFAITFAISITIQIILFSIKSGPFRAIILRVFFVGVIVHELSHFVASLMVGIVPSGIKIKFRDEETEQPNPHGSVSTTRRRTFLQDIIISLAPLFVTAWLTFVLLNVVFSKDFDPLLRILAGFLCVSVLVAGAPSLTDFKLIPKVFALDPIHSIYQVFLLLISTIATWFFTEIFRVEFSLEILYFLMIVMFYTLFKYGFAGIDWLIHTIRSRRSYKSPRINLNQYIRKKIKPTKPRKLGYKEAPW